MASTNDLDMADTYNKRMAKKPVGESYPTDEIYIQYAEDLERVLKQRKATLDVLKFYRKTDLIPTNRRIIKTNKDLRLLIEMLGLEDL